MLKLGCKTLKEENTVKKDLTELVFILDRSGSMGGLEKDTIGGYNALLSKQKATSGDCLITTVLFDTTMSLFHDRTTIQAVNELTAKEYQVGGSTALLDAMGHTILKIDNAINHTAVDYQPSKVMMVIITDGEENASHTYNLSQIKNMIEQKKKQGWEFIFLGANIDAVTAAADFGISADRAQNYHADSAGVNLNFRVMSEAISSFRENSEMNPDWNEKIQEDYNKRGTKK
jgi:uncharacterized protein YegL